MKIDSKLHRIYVKRSKNDDLPSNICFEADFNHKNHQKPLKMTEICPKSLGRSVGLRSFVGVTVIFSPRISGKPGALIFTLFVLFKSLWPVLFGGPGVRYETQ